jgi:hypothetical protein
MADASDAGDLVWLAIYWWNDNEPAGSIEKRDVWSATGRLRIEYMAFRPDDKADISLVASLRARYEAPDAGKDQRDKIEDAAAEYAASRAEDQLGIAWESSQSFPLTDVIDLLNGSAEWLRGLVTAAVIRDREVVGAGHGG